jgi:hypothetical protein
MTYTPQKKLITAIYNDENKWYIRIITGETKRFPHGIALASSCSSKESVLAFQQEVNKYLGATSLETEEDEEVLWDRP